MLASIIFLYSAYGFAPSIYVKKSHTHAISVVIQAYDAASLAVSKCGRTSSILTD